MDKGCLKDVCRDDIVEASTSTRDSEVGYLVGPLLQASDGIGVLFTLFLRQRMPGHKDDQHQETSCRIIGLNTILVDTATYRECNPKYGASAS